MPIVKKQDRGNTRSWQKEKPRGPPSMGARQPAAHKSSLRTHTHGSGRKGEKGTSTRGSEKGGKKMKEVKGIETSGQVEYHCFKGCL